MAQNLLTERNVLYKSSAVAEMGDRGHNRHGPKRGGGAVPFRGALESVYCYSLYHCYYVTVLHVYVQLRSVILTNKRRFRFSLIQCGLCRGLLPYQVASSSIEPFGHNSIGCHSPRRNISTNYYLIVEVHTATVRSDDARYLLN